MESMATLAGSAPDLAVARRLGVTRQAVEKYRAANGIGRFRSPVAKEVDWDSWPLGLFPDHLIAENAKVNRASVVKARSRRGIPVLRLLLVQGDDKRTGNVARQSELAAERRLRMRGTVGAVYFLRAGNWVKIGWTSKPMSQRHRQIQACCPMPVEVLCVLHEQTQFAERRLHDRFAKHRVHGEWFAFVDEVHKYIADQQA